ncbi:MAG TPA: urease subunit beta, partial [Thermomicrobiaceae bacterium]|nr:urease subunit beta [Thermomicrobiaceae bacterium]
NPRLCFDRRRAFGMRPDVPVGGAVRVEPGATVELTVVPFTGRRTIYGFNGLVDGPLDEADLDALLARLIARGFCHRPDTGTPPLPALAPSGEGVGG